MKRFFIALIVTLIIIVIINFALFDNIYNYHNLSNSFFIVGMVIFCVGLISITEASKVFKFIGYSMKSVMKRKQFKYKSYYDYLKENSSNKMTPYMLQLFVIGIGYIATAAILAHYALQ